MPEKSLEPCKRLLIYASYGVSKRYCMLEPNSITCTFACETE